METLEELRKTLAGLERRIENLEDQANLADRKRQCNHATINWGVHKRKCTRCGEIFITD